MLELDSTFCKVHPNACSGRKDQAIGSSRGGKNTKVHFLINERMQLLKVILIGGQVHDSEPSLALLSGVELGGKTILADKAYSSEQIRCFIAEYGAVACIPDKTNFKIKHDFDCELYKQLNLASVFFSASRITGTSPLASTKWLFVLRISFYSLLLLFKCTSHKFFLLRRV